jgi:hypothetical protein
MDTKTAGTAVTGQRPWVCEVDMGTGWRLYGVSPFGTVEAVRRAWRVTSWRHGSIPRARARNTVTGESVEV